MKKYILMLSIFAACFMIASVSALTIPYSNDFSIRGNSEVKTDHYYYRITTSIWHSDRANKGMGSFMLDYSDRYSLYRLNLKLEETNITFVGSRAYGIVDAKGIEWDKWNQKAIISKVFDYNVNYVYDREEKTITFSKIGMPSVTIPVIAYK